MKPVGIFSERDFIKAIARDGAAVLGVEVQQLMSTPVLTCRPSDRIDAVLATTNLPRVRRCGEKTSFISLTSEERRARPHMGRT
jgi:CBS domain-containing protein